MTHSIIQAQVAEIKPLNAHVMQIILEPSEYVDYHAGQYLQIHLDHEALSYSIANAPGQHEKYELHIKRNLSHSSNCRLFDLFSNQTTVNLSLPYGHCSLNQLDANKPILFIAGGTGFAPVKAMIEHLIANRDSRRVELIWGVRSAEGLYMDSLVKDWVKKAVSFTYYPVIDQSNFALASFVQGKHPDDLDNWQIVISGAFEMVYSIRDELVSHGVSRETLYSDAFAFE